MLNGLNHITVTVKDLDASLEFYAAILGMKPIVRWQKGAYLTLGALWFCLSSGESLPAGDYSHIALNVEESDFPDIEEKLLNVGAQVWQENTSEGNSIYFLDPNGHKFEVHSGSLESRLLAIRDSPYEGLEWL